MPVYISVKCKPVTNNPELCFYEMNTLKSVAYICHLKVPQKASYEWLSICSLFYKQRIGYNIGVIFLLIKNETYVC